MVKYKFGFDHLAQTSSQNRNDDTLAVELDEQTENENNPNEELSKLKSLLAVPSCSKKNVSWNELRCMYWSLTSICK